ncbi:MAG TPA: LCP family protein [Candidatus Pullilachnospira intestinigallinarum]|nr:LCP family protein [Candidatus Pullilachnospira intestinigallinarum]
MADKKTMTKKQRRIRRKRRRRRILFALEILVLLVLVGCLFVYAKLNSLDFVNIDLSNIGISDTVKNNEVMQGYTTIGLVGVDSRDGDLETGTNSDTMIIASINNDTKEVKLVSVYRDTYLRIGEDEEGNGIYNKANSAYAKYGPEGFMRMLNSNMDLNVTYFVTVDFQAVAEAVELLGGIDEELSEEEIIHLNNYCKETSEVTGMDYEPLDEVAGVHHLNGVQTVAYARIRYTVGDDFRRAARQREVIYKIVEKAKNADVGTLTKILDKVFPSIKTNMTKADILSMGLSMISYDIVDQAGFPHDHVYGENVKNAMNGLDCVVPVTLESNVIWLHQFLYPEDAYEPSENVKAYSNRIIETSGYSLEDQLSVSEDGSLAAYREIVEGEENGDGSGE